MASLIQPLFRHRSRNTDCQAVTGQNVHKKANVNRRAACITGTIPQHYSSLSYYLPQALTGLYKRRAIRCNLLFVPHKSISAAIPARKHTIPYF